MSLEQARAAKGFLYLLRNEPTLMDEAPLTPTALEMEERRTQGRPCLRCGGKAEMALVAQVPGPQEAPDVAEHGPVWIGSRWVDICFPCRSWLDEGLMADDRGGLPWD